MKRWPEQLKLRMALTPTGKSIAVPQTTSPASWKRWPCGRSTAARIDQGCLNSHLLISLSPQADIGPCGCPRGLDLIPVLGFSSPCPSESHPHAYADEAPVSACRARCMLLLLGYLLAVVVGVVLRWCGMVLTTGFRPLNQQKQKTIADLAWFWLLVVHMAIFFSLLILTQPDISSRSWLSTVLQWTAI